MPYFLLGLRMLADSSNTVLAKRFSRSMNSDMLHFIEYNLFNASFATVFLFAINKFSFKMNGATLIYSLIFAALVILSVSLNVLAHKRVSVYLVGLTSQLGSLIISTFFGIIFLDDPVTPEGIISMLLMISAVVIPYIGQIEKGKKGSILVPVLYFMIGGAVNVVMKVFTLDSRVTDSRSFFIASNIVIVAATACALAAYIIVEPKHCRDLLHAFTLREIGNVAARTTLSNVSSVLGIIVLSGMTLGVYTVATSSFGIISGAFLSLAVFRERLNIATCISVILALAAVVVAA